MALRMYEAPEINFSFLMELSETFGTREIDVDNYSTNNEGCETCDYGSCYGHTVQVLNPTRNYPEVDGDAFSKHPFS